MEKKIGFLQEAPGVFSITRLVFVWLILNATLMSWVALLMKGGGVGAATAIFGTVSSVATGLKLIQKGQEIKTKKKDDGRI